MTSTAIANRSNVPARGTSMEDTPLSTTLETSRELTPGSGAAMAQFEIQGAIVLAKKFPRIEDDAYARLQKSCRRPAFADKATYSFPRGGTEVTGPSVYIAREAARLWGNIRYGFDIVSDDDEMRHVRGWAWDLETNTKVSEDVSFKKLVQRKRDGRTVWVTPDERDLRELTNKESAKATRNCILQLLPKDMIDEAIDIADKTLEGNASSNPDEARRKLVIAFGDLGVSAGDLEEYLGHKLTQASPAEVAKLRGVYSSIRDGNSTWAEYVSKAAPADAKKKPATNGGVSGSDLRGDPLGGGSEPKSPPQNDSADPVTDAIAEQFNNAPHAEAVHELTDGYMDPAAGHSAEVKEFVKACAEARLKALKKPQQKSMV